MPCINILPESLRNKIAAGEVVERPAFVVKELIDNSIDAGAKSIDVEVIGAGKRLIRVSDDGCGMEREDALRCFLPHSTSKIATEEDLYNLRTLGFRGEALASIAAISRLKIITAPLGEMGLSVEIEGGLLKETIPVATRGTTVEVRGLFFNTPARLKFLKSDPTENHHILETVTRIALCNETLSFYLTLGGSQTLSLPPARDKRERIQQLYGMDFTDRLIEVPLSGHDISGVVFIGQEGLYRHNKQGQRVFINQRPVRDYGLSQAVYQALEGLMPKELHPVFFIYLQVSPNLVDFNVHPTKSEVRFADKEAAFKVVYQAIKGLFNKNRVCVQNDNHLLGAGELPRQATTVEHNAPERPLSVQEQALPYNVREPIIPLYICDTLIAINEEGGLSLIDYHAAHERVNYERLLKRIAPPQALLFPYTVRLEPSAYNAVVSNLELLKDLGLEVDEFGPDTVIVRAVPEFLTNADMAILLRDVAEAILQRQDTEEGLLTKDPIEAKKRKVAARLACHASLRGKMQCPDRDQLAALLRQLKDCEDPHLCPHGRPTKITINQRELLRMFRRL